MPRIVVLTSNSEYAERILLGLALNEVVPEAVLFADIPPSRAHSFQARSFLAKLHKYLRSHSLRQLTMIMLRRTLAPALRRALSALEPIRTYDREEEWMNRWLGFAHEVQPVGPLNGEGMLSNLRRLSPDYLVVAGTGIVKAEALRIPNYGAINVHPAILPWVRGSGVVDRSLQHRVPVGVTAHFVNAGIDTGGIIHRELISVQNVDTLQSLRLKASGRCAQLMVEVITGIAQGQHPTAVKQQQRFPICRRPPLEERAQIEAAVRDGLALKIYREWKDFFGGHVLPLNINGSPPVAVEPIPRRKHK